MTDYTITTDFGAKDSLPSGNAAKIIKGSEFTTEFTNILTAVNSKADTAGDTFTGAVTFDDAVTLNADVTFDTNTMFVDVSENRVGIGTTTPLHKVDIMGDESTAYDATSDSGQSNHDATLQVFNKNSTDESFASLVFRNRNSGVGISRISSISKGSGTTDMAFVTENSNVKSEKLRIKADGNVGIGTTSPTSLLHLKSSSAPTLKIDDSDSTYALELAQNDVNGSVLLKSAGTLTIGVDHDSADAVVVFQTRNDERMRISSSGNVGIGTTSPASKLHVQGTGTTAIQVTGGSNNVAGIYLGDAGGLANGRLSYSNADNSLQLFTSGSEAMRIDASGNLLVGTTDVVALNGGFSVTTGSVDYINVGHASSVAHGNYYAAFRHGTNTIGTITQNGTTGVLYNTSSDERLKENITDSADAGSNIDAIQIRQFDWKSDGSHQDYGVIAQELVTVAPEAVHQPVDEEDMMGVDYSKLVPMLIKEVQTLRNRVAQLENN